MSGQEPEYAYWEMLAEGLREHGVKDFAYEYWKALADRLEGEGVPARVVAVALKVMYYGAASLSESPLVPSGAPLTEEEELGNSPRMVWVNAEWRPDSSGNLRGGSKRAGIHCNILARDLTLTKPSARIARLALWGDLALDWATIESSGVVPVNTPESNSSAISIRRSSGSTFAIVALLYGQLAGSLSRQQYPVNPANGTEPVRALGPTGGCFSSLS